MKERSIPAEVASLSPPQPEFPMKPEERRLFLAEQTFLVAVGRLIGPIQIDTLGQRQALRRYLSDISSTEMASEAFLAYGLEGNRCLSDGDLGKRFGKSYHTVNTDRRVVLQSLWLEHGAHFSPKVYGFARFLPQRYARKGEQTLHLASARVLRRAEANLRYYNDRLFLLENEAAILDLLGGLYGQRTRELFAQYYRLEDYRDSQNFERRGVYTFRAGLVQERLALEDALEAGRATAEHLAGLRYGSRKWTDLRGSLASGYRRKGTRFKSTIAAYQYQQRVQAALTDPASELKPLEKALLQMTTTTRLCGETKSTGLEQFNRQFGTNYGLTTVAELERKALREFERERLVIARRIDQVKKLLRNSSLQQDLSQRLAGLVYDYHVGGERIVDIAISHSLYRDYAGALQRLLSRLIMQTNVVRKGDISEALIDRYFENDLIPPPLAEILRWFTKPLTLREVLFKVGFRIRVEKHALAGLRQMATAVVEEYEHRTAKV